MFIGCRATHLDCPATAGRLASTNTAHAKHVHIVLSVMPWCSACEMEKEERAWRRYLHRETTRKPASNHAEAQITPYQQEVTLTSSLGGGNSIFRSILPGRNSAGSRISIRFVAMMTLMFFVASKPSSWLRSSNMVRCTSLSPSQIQNKGDNRVDQYATTTEYQLKNTSAACRCLTRSLASGWLTNQASNLSLLTSVATALSHAVAVAAAAAAAAAAADTDKPTHPLLYFLRLQYCQFHP